MIELIDIKDKIEKTTIAIASCDKNNLPHNIAVMYAKVIDNQLVITNNFMKRTIENIKNNSHLSLVFWEEEKGWRIDGNAEYYDSGKWLDFVKNLKENKGLPARGALIIKVDKISPLS